tara:strand:+ start:427 stop:639 length:213 start_codon:yes stop_codon:yes gene_type:complete
MQNYELQMQRIKQLHKDKIVRNLISSPNKTGHERQDSNFAPLPVYPTGFIKEFNMHASNGKVNNRSPNFY